MILAVVGSPWQVIVLGLYYRTILKGKDIIIIFEKASERSFKASNNLLINDLYFSYVYNWIDVKGIKNAFSAKKYTDELLYNLDFSKVNKFIVGSENNELVRYINLRISDSAYRIKIDDGVLDYLPDLANLKSLRYIFRLLIGYGFSIFKRFKPNQVFMVYPNHYVSINNLDDTVHKIDLSYFKTELRALLKTNNQLPFGFNESVYLLIGQALYEDNVISIEDEISLYYECINNIPDLEGVRIYFKSHPRSSPEKMEKISELISSSNIELLDTDLSVEELYVNSKIEKVYGLYSNGVIYSKILFDIPAESMIPIIIKKTHLNNTKLSYIHKELLNLNKS